MLENELAKISGYGFSLSKKSPSCSINNVFSREGAWDDSPRTRNEITLLEASRK